MLLGVAVNYASTRSIYDLRNTAVAEFALRYFGAVPAPERILRRVEIVYQFFASSRGLRRFYSFLPPKDTGDRRGYLTARRGGAGYYPALVR